MTTAPPADTARPSPEGPEGRWARRRSPAAEWRFSTLAGWAASLSQEGAPRHRAPRRFEWLQRSSQAGMERVARGHPCTVPYAARRFDGHGLSRGASTARRHKPPPLSPRFKVQRQSSKTTRHPAPKDPAPKGPAPKGPAPKGPAPKDPAPKGPAPKGPAPKGPAPKGPAPKGAEDHCFTLLSRRT